MSQSTVGLRLTTHTPIMKDVQRLLTTKQQRFIFSLFSVLFIVGGTILAIRFAKGNRPTLSGDVRETGLLVVNSLPTGAQVFINDRLTSATDDTINLDPNTYQIELRKEGYTPWKKSLRIEKELVTQTNAILFPAVPSLSPLTFTGVHNLSPAPDGQKLVYFTASASAELKNGLYIVDLTDNPLSLQRGSRQIVRDTTLIDLSAAQIIWSPDSSEFLLSNDDRNYLIDITKVNDLSTLKDISIQKEDILSSWEEEMYLRERQILQKFPDEIIAIATASAVNVYFSPDQEKLLYTAMNPVTIPDTIIPSLPASNNQIETRTLVPHDIYIYDRKEDKNFLVGHSNKDEIQDSTLIARHKKLLTTDITTPLALDASPSAFTTLQASTSAQTAANFRNYHSALYTEKLQWYPDSRHLIRTNPQNISILEYDNTNETIIYAGPFQNDFVYPWSNGDKLLITTSFNLLPATLQNLYAIQLR